MIRNQLNLTAPRLLLAPPIKFPHRKLVQQMTVISMTSAHHPQPPRQMLPWQLSILKRLQKKYKPHHGQKNSL